jgi:hypothetical protein
VGAGYPDPKLYIFEAEKADDIAEKLLRRERLFSQPTRVESSPRDFWGVLG